VIVDAVADLPTLTLTGAASGAEDTAIALPDIAAALQDSDGSESLTLTISGVPTGATLSAGTDNGDGSWTLTGLSQAQLDALTITPPADFSGSFDLTVTATATEAATTAGGGELQEADNTATTSQAFTVTVTPTGDSSLTAGNSAVKEDLGAADDQIAAVPAPNSGSQPVVITLVLGANETAGSITLTGVPSGLTFNNGAAGPGNTWVLTQGQLSGLAVTGVPGDSDAEIALGVVASVSQNGVPLPNLTGSLTITVDAVADVPTLTLTGAASGAEDSVIALPDIAAALQDSDGSETLSLTISGVPTGATLSAGTDQGGGVWNLAGLTQAQINALTITPPAEFAGSFNLTVTATAREAATVAGGGEMQEADNTAATAQSFTVTVTPGRDSTLSVSDVAVKEDLGTAADQIAAVPQPNSGAQPVAISLALAANETATSITISGVPAGMTLNHGTNNGDGTWTLSQADLTGLTLNGTPSDSDAEFDLGVTVGISQAGQSLPDLTGTVHVTVDAVADIPTLTLTGTAAGNSGTPIALPDIAAALHDVDSSETLTLTISGVPTGATLSAGTNQGGGVWSLTGLTQPQLDALTLTPPAGYSGSFNLTVTATATEAATVAGGGELQEADNTASTAQSFSVLVNAVPSGGSASNFVSEDGIEAVGPYNVGTQAETAHEIATGTLGYNFGGDGSAASHAFAWSATVGATDPDGGGSFSGLTSQGQAVVWSVSADGLTITGSTAVSHDVVATLTITNPATGAYSYEQIGAFDHPDLGQSGAADPINLGFGYTITDGNGDTATGNLTIAVRDDGPIAGVVNQTGDEGGGVDTNLLVILDVSGSMDDASGLTNLTRLDVAKAAIADLIEQYDSLGDVAVHIVTFSTSASDASDVWLTADQAISFLDSLSAGGFTNYDAALAAAQAAFVESGKIADAQNVSYFLSDGKPNRPDGSPGINGSEQASWENFLQTHDIKSYALGMGGDLDASALQPIAFDGITSTDIPAVVVTDLAQLSATLLETVVPSTATGNIIVDSVPVGELGADGGYIKSIVVDGTTYTFNPASGGSVTATGGTDHGSFDTSTNTLTIDTAAGASIALDMDGGDYIYTAPTSIAANLTENFAYTLVDGDGDTATSTLTFNTIDTDQAPLVYSDAVITNVSGSGAAVPVPSWALLANDVDPDGNAIAMSGVSGATDGSVALASGTATFTDNDSDGGSFNYTGTANGLSNLGHVTIDRGQAGESTLDGTGLDEILIGRSSNDTLKGYEGDDILIGGGGTDTLQGGAGNDILVFQNTASSYDGGTGTDVLRIGDSLSGTIDLRAAATSDSRLENIDTLSMDGGNNVTIQLDYQGILDLEPGSNTLRITGSIGDSVDLNEATGTSGTDTWIKTASDAMVDTWQYTPSAAGSPTATLIVDRDVTVT
ncbi:MAG: VWA domain-containing protein, partial [Alphaproteobacteria bacterium]|nr:VWA domain-containing protein [Alphaproteobacteria bacterium]